jgi:putative transposase
VKTHQAFRYELAPNLSQRLLLAKHSGTARFAWNWALAERIRRYQAKEGPARFTSAIEQHRELNARKATEWPWMYEVSKCAPHEALRDLDRVFRNLVRARKAGRYCGFPRFKRKGVRDSFRLNGSIGAQPEEAGLAQSHPFRAAPGTAAPPCPERTYGLPT